MNNKKILACLLAAVTLMGILLTGCSLLGEKEYTCQELTLTVGEQIQSAATENKQENTSGSIFPWGRE